MKVKILRVDDEIGIPGKIEDKASIVYLRFMMDGDLILTNIRKKLQEPKHLFW